MKRATTCFMLLTFTLMSIGVIQAQNQVTYGFVQDPVNQLKLTAVAYPNFTSNNVTISTALFTFYLPAGTITTPAIPVLPAFGSFTDITGTWRIEKITPALYASFGFNANDLQGNDIYQCILQNSPSPNTINGQPVSLFSFTLPGDCMGGTVQVHINDNSIQMALLNNVGININNQMSVSVNDAPSFDLYSGNNPVTDNYDCPLDDVPVAVDDVASTNEDVAVTVNVTSNDNFGTDGPSTGAITITIAPANGVAVVDNNGTPNNPTDDKIVYTPNPNFNGTDVLTYQICDADNDCDLATVTITVNAVNDPPLANDDTATTPEDNAVTFSITANDSDVDGFIDPTSVDLDPNTAGIQTTFVVAGGTFTYLGAGNVTFTPNANFNGTATAQYQVCDTGTPLPAMCDQATITVTVTPANDPPTVPNTTVSTPEDTPFNVCVPITDVDNNSFAVVNICAPDGGVVSGLTNPATTQYCLTYTPNLNYTGPDTLCIQVCDGSGGCDTSYVIIDVTPVNDPPVANDDATTTSEDTPVTLTVTTNDTDVDGLIDPATVDLDPNTAGIQTTFVAAGGTFTYLGAGNVTFTPNANFTGTATADYRVCDTGTPLPAMCDIATITITVNAANDPPTVPNTTVSTPEDTPFNVCVPITDVDNSTFAVVNICAPDGGVVSGLTNPATTQYCLTYTPNLNFNGPDTLCIQVCDGSGGCDTSYVIITVTPVNDPPIANDDATTTTEDAPVTLTVTTNDTDVDGLIDPTTVDLDPVAPGIQTTFVVAGGTFTYLGAGNVTFTPNLNFNGTATADYRVCDTGTPLPAMCDIATITITVNAVNDPPIANDDATTTNEDTPVTLTVTTNDTDVDGLIDPTTVDLDPNTAGIQTTLVVAGGTFTYLGAGNVTFTPNANFTGTATADYRVCDTGTPLPSLCDIATITITVSPVNDPPTVPNTTVSTPEDTPFNVCVPITDVDNTTFAVVNVCAPDGGVVSGLTNPASSQYCLTYTPNLNFSGPDTLCIQVCDGAGGCDTSYVIITVTPVNDPPVANDDATTTNEDAPVTLTVTTNDTDVDGLIDPTTVDLDPVAPGIQTTYVVAGGTFTYLGAGNVTFTPNLNFNGTATADYRVCDTGTPLPAMCDIATITITVNAVNDPPVANDDATTTSEDTPVTLTVTTNDTDVDGLIDPTTVDLDPNTAGIQTTFVVAGGTFTYLGAGNVTFTPNANFTGTATADYRVCDTGTPLPSLCDIATITITVNAANDPPTVPNTTVSTPEDTPFNVCVPITDVDNSTFAVVNICAPDGGVVSGLTNPATTQYCLTYTPNLNFTGPDTLCIQVCDGSGGCDTSYVIITVTPVNDPPIANDDATTTTEDTPVTLTVTTNDTDVDGLIDPTTVDLNPNVAGIQTTFVVAGGTFTYLGAGNVTFTPNANFNGTATADYRVCDTGTPLPAMCDIATITITVNAVNDPPIANDDATTTNEDSPVTLTVTTNDTDVDGLIDPTTVDLNPNVAGIQTTFVAAGGTFTYLGAGNVTFTPNANFNGTATADYRVCDTGTPLPSMCDIATITITVNAVNDPPIANNDITTTAEDTPITLTVTTNDTDVDGLIDPATLDLDPVAPGIQTTFVVAGGTFTYLGAGNVTFTPNANFTGTAIADYRVCDTGTPLPSLCDIGTIIITVSPANDPPTVPNTTVSTPEDTPFNVCVPITDVDNTSFAVASICAPDGGVVSGLTNPATSQYCLTYTPNLNYTGPDTLCIQVCDGSGGCDTSYVIITVTPVNDPPIANDDATTTTEDTPVTLTVTTNDTDVDGLIDPTTVDLDPVTPGIQTTFVVAGGTFTYLGAGNLTFTPNLNFNGTATADYRVCDTGTPLPAMCDIATITITVNAVNDPPIANDDATSTPEDTPVTLAITPNDTDVDGLIDPTTVDLNPGVAGIQTTFVAAGGTFTYLGAGNVTFTPNLNFNGTATADYRVCDTGTPLPSMCDIATITITVNAVNDPPIANNDSATTPEDTPVPVPVLNNDTDVDGTLTPGSVAVINSPDNGSASVNNLTGVITYTPNLNFVGNDTLTYAVCDSGTPILCDTATVVFTVTATSVRLLGVMRLQGSLFNTPDTLTLMRDNLRSLGRLPKKEPYTALPAFVHYGGGGGEMVLDSATVFSNRGANSIVDWVFVELRNPAQSNQVVATRAALLQRDGDIVDMDGLSALTFENKLPANYFVSVRHRNHLGVMTANAMALTNSGTIVDFTNLSTPIWDDGTNLDGFEQKTINGKYALWAGNVNTNASVVFAGQNNDKDPLFNQVDQAPGNFLHSQSFIYNGYHLGDVNMDGKAVFAGQTNDVDFIFNNVDSHPRNITRSQSFIIKQQLPQ